MQEPPIITRRQGVGVMKKRPVKKYLINISASDNSAEGDDKQSCDRIFHNLFALYRCSPKRQIWRRQLLFLGCFRRTIGTIALVEFRSEVRVVLNLFAQLVNIKIGHRYFRAHQNNQLAPHISGCRITKQRAQIRNAIQNRKAFNILLLTVGDEATQNDGGSTWSGNACSHITGGDVWN